MCLKRMLAGVTLLASGATSAAADVDVFAEFDHWMIAAKESACFAIPVPLREVGHAMTIKGDNFVIFSRGFDFDADANPENTPAILQIGNWVEVGTVLASKDKSFSTIFTYSPELHMSMFLTEQATMRIGQQKYIVPITQLDNALLAIEKCNAVQNLIQR